ncbi:MAG TPA: winged helix DNA-binding domain-containing protein [Ktedonobacterales bacterium]
MAATPIALRRLAQQCLTHQPLATPAEVVAWMGAVQAQDYLGAQWSLGLRLRGATEDAIERAFAEGSILRTHALRPTWHFVTPADIRWLLELTAPRVKPLLAAMHRRFELDEALFARANTLIAQALAGGQQLTRGQLGVALARGGILAQGQRLGHIVHHAELDAIVCSGPRRGKQFTYALLADRAPHASTLPREQAVAELTRRYYTSHGPATIKDFVWWSGLTTADARVGLALAGAHLAHETLDGATYYFAAAPLAAAPLAAAPLAAAPLAAAPAPTAPTALLLPTFDEFHVGYAAFDQSRRGGPDAAGPLVFDATIVVDGQVAGSWRRTLTPNAVAIELAPFVPLASDAGAAVAAAAQRYAAFLGLPLTMASV